MEVLKRERKDHVQPPAAVDAFMRARALQGQRSSIVTDQVLRVLGLDVSRLPPSLLMINNALMPRVPLCHIFRSQSAVWSWAPPTRPKFIHYPGASSIGSFLSVVHIVNVRA